MKKRCFECESCGRKTYFEGDFVEGCLLCEKCMDGKLENPLLKAVNVSIEEHLVFMEVVEKVEGDSICDYVFDYNPKKKELKVVSCD